MKKKALGEPVISPEILARAKQLVSAERGTGTKPCAVCGAPGTPQLGPQAELDDLCWVCRRLKISAWRDAEQPVQAQE